MTSAVVCTQCGSLTLPCRCFRDSSHPLVAPYAPPAPKKKKLKAAEVFDLRSLRAAQVFTEYDCLTKKVTTLRDRATAYAAVRVNATTGARKLVYGFCERSGELVGQVLITMELLKLDRSES